MVLNQLAKKEKEEEEEQRRMNRSLSGISDGGFSTRSSDGGEEILSQKNVIVTNVVTPQIGEISKTSSIMSLEELRVIAKRRHSSISGRRDSTSSRRRSSAYSRRRSSVRKNRQSVASKIQESRELTYDEWVASFTSSTNRSSVTSGMGTTQNDKVTTTGGDTTKTTSNGSRRKTNLNTPSSIMRKSLYVSRHTGDAFVEKLHDIFFNKIRKGDGGDQFGENELREVIRSALNNETSEPRRFSGVKKSQRRRATVIARMVFERSDYDCSNSVDFPEFLEFVVTLISAIFIAQLNQKHQMQHRMHHHLDKCYVLCSVLMCF